MTLSPRVLLLLGKALLLALPPLGLAVSYVVADPFWVLYHYPHFSGTLLTVPNRDYISTQMYLNNNPQRRYRSFIFGDSRTMAFRVRDWAAYTGDPASFHFDASSESLYGVWKKLAFLEQRGVLLRHVLLVVDPYLLRQTQDIHSHLMRKDPRVTGEWPVGFQLTFFKAYLTNHFYVKYWKRRLTGRYTPDMATMLEGRRVCYDPVTNDLGLPDAEAEIRSDSVGYYARRIFPARPARPVVSPAVIGAAQEAQLRAVQGILRRSGASYRIVISPVYTQEAMHSADVAVLKHMFGAQFVYDFSGINRYTQPLGNHYEEYHFRPLVGRQLLKIIYAEDSATYHLAP